MASFIIQMPENAFHILQSKVLKRRVLMFFSISLSKLLPLSTRLGVVFSNHIVDQLNNRAQRIIDIRVRISQRQRFINRRC
ncbi:hypothetical protein EUA59_02465 [TM7 phylum sp. oral taxon 346]|nr:hypothetical protein EUA59_02465 [TM7 phylum sp. oral taxon 346]